MKFTVKKKQKKLSILLSHKLNKYIIMKKAYQIICRETGDIIDIAYSESEADAKIDSYELEDKANGSFSPNFYEKIELNSNVLNK